MNFKLYIERCIKYLVSLCLLAVSQHLGAQVNHIGKVVSWEKTPTGIEGKTGTTFFKIQVYNENMIRVRVSRNKTMDDFSYSLVQAVPQGIIDFKVVDNNSSVRIQTEQLTLKSKKNRLSG